MSNSALNTSLKYENIKLQEDLIFYKSRNIHLNGKVQVLENKMRILKERLKKHTATGKTIEEDYPLGQHFPERLLHS